MKRTAFEIDLRRVRKVIYLTIVRSHLAYGSQAWAPQTANNILTVSGVVNTTI